MSFQLMLAAAQSDSPVSINSTMGGSTARSDGRVRSSADTEAEADLGDRLCPVLIPSTEIAGHTPAGSAGTNPTDRTEKSKKRVWLKRHISHSHSRTELVSVLIYRSEYLRYFAKDEETGQFREGVVEPPGGRAEWLRRRVEEQAEWQAERGDS